MTQPTKSEIRDILINTCREMKLIYKKGGYKDQWSNKWRDDVNKEGLVISGEALASFLVVVDAFPKKKDKIFNIIGEDLL